MMSWLQAGAGLALMLAGWGYARHVAKARFPVPLIILLHDALAPLGTFIVLLGATGRPLFAGSFAFAAFGGFGFADGVKRAVLREPIVFTDMSEVIELFRHPRFYLPFAGTGRVLAGMALAVLLFAALFRLEPPLFAVSMLQAALWLGGGLLFIVLLVMLVRPWARLLRRLAPSGDALADARRFGPFAMLGVHGVIARAERKMRRTNAPVLAVDLPAGCRPPLVLVQSESFFDVRRLGLDDDALPGFAAAVREAAQWGRLETACWGANTTRTEFSVLTGLGDGETGFDHFNPYHAFARRLLPSLAWTLKAQGYQTVCVHPFDLRFYGRARVMRCLGFDRLVGPEAFTEADRAGLYVSDAALARHCVRLLDEAAGPLFVFAITMENHGPWVRGAELPVALRGADEGEGLGQYLHGLRSSDRMLNILRAGLGARQGVLGFYGDHMPSLPKGFAGLNFDETHTDYFLWRAGRGTAMPAPRRDIAAHDMPGQILALLREAAHD